MKKVKKAKRGGVDTSSSKNLTNHVIGGADRLPLASGGRTS